MYGFDVQLIDETTGEEITEANKKGVIAVNGPLPPGCLQTVWETTSVMSAPTGPASTTR